MRIEICLLALLVSTSAVAHPGGGIVALSERSAVLADSVENHLWLVHQGREPERIVSRFHGHWLTQGLDGQVYAEAFQESGGAWSSAAFRLDVSKAKLVEIAHRDDLGALVFAVDRDGSLIFQRGPVLKYRREGQESVFRPHRSHPPLENVTAFAWSTAGVLLVADQNRVYGVDATGVATLVAEIKGKSLEPRIWSATERPRIFSLATEGVGMVLAAVPDLGKVYRLGKDGVAVEIAREEDGWRATGVATFGGSVFLLESHTRTSTSPRVRVLRPEGSAETLVLPRDLE